MFDIVVNALKKTVINYVLITLLLCITDLSVCAQNDYVVIDSIIISGNRITHNHIIAYEMSIKKGDTIPLVDFNKMLAGDERRLQSMGLFTDVKCNIINWQNDHASIDIRVLENWYLYPYVIFELADRNFNVWREEFDYSLERVNYGVAVTHINFTGNKDKLKLKWQAGFTRKYEIFYEFPYIYRGWGLSTNYLYSENKQIGYLPDNNYLKFYKSLDDRIIFSQHRANITLHKRANAYLNHQIRVEYLNLKVDDVIGKELNPEYFGDSRTNLRFMQFDYLLRWDRTVYPLYPMGGYKLVLNVRKDGIGGNNGVNNLLATLDLSHHLPMGKRFILSNRVKTKLHLLDQPIPYYMYSGIGYGDDILSGFQLRVLDGRNYILNKNAIRCRLIDHTLVSTLKLPKAVKTINVKAYLRFNLDYGYVYDPVYRETNTLNNKHKIGYGPGIDVILLNNLTLTADYSITIDGQKGLFFGGGVNF